MQTQAVALTTEQRRDKKAKPVKEMNRPEYEVTL